MANETSDTMGKRERVSRQQALLDNWVLLLAAGLLVPTVFFIVWTLVSLISVPPFTR
jgi:hypothetical protein